VRRAEDRVQGLSIVRSRAESEQSCFHGFHMLGTFLHEGLAKLAEVDLHVYALSETLSWFEG
jgi:hypothetical protein